MAANLPSGGIPILELIDITKKYNYRTVLDGVTVALDSGDCGVIFGPNGAGKTTLLRIAAGLERQDRGRVVMFGESMEQGKDRVSAMKRLSLISHDTMLYDYLTARENLVFFGRLYGMKEGDAGQRAEELLEEFGLLHRSEDRVATFSRGMKQRLSVARALMHRPMVIFMDEPFTGLDENSARHLAGLLGYLRRDGRTLLVVTHNLERGWELASEVMVLDRGRIRLRGRKTDWELEDFRAAYASLTGADAP